MTENCFSESYLPRDKFPPFLTSQEFERFFAYFEMWTNNAYVELGVKKITLGEKYHGGTMSDLFKNTEYLLLTFLSNVL
jgi:hypothetical protein